MMKAITWLAAAPAIAIVLGTQSFAKEGWMTDLDKAIAEAGKENKSVLVEFTGSDWCPPCIAMRKNVFSKKEFTDAAAKKFVLVELDFPKKDKELAEKNQPLAEKYKIEGFPTVILLDSKGEEFTRFFASRYPTVEDFLAHLDDALEKKDMD
ncbi:MAG: thioredoxin family protein [Luteolibacter sp.]